MDDGVYYDSIWAYEGDTYSPDFDMYLWNYDGYADPGDTLASFITAQIENWNEPCWSNAEYDRRSWTRPTASSIRRSARISSGRRSRSSTSSRRRSPSTTRRSSRPSTRRSGTAGRACTAGTGAAFYTSFVRDSYLNLKPRTAVAGRGSGGLGRRDGRRDRCRRGRSRSSWVVVVLVRGRRGGRPRRSEASGAAGPAGAGSARRADLDAVLARAFGRVERGVGARHQVVHVPGHVRAGRDADAHRDAAGALVGHRNSRAAMARRRRSARASRPRRAPGRAAPRASARAPPGRASLRRADGGVLGRMTANSSPP